MAIHKLPVQQLTILAILRLAEPVALTSVFPYLPEMMEYLSVPTSEIAFYAGLMTAIFSLAQCLTGIAWGRASDRFGRKPVILTAVTCAMISSLLFGLSRSLAWALVARAAGGLSNGNVGLMRTAVAELVPYKELQPRAFSIMPLVWAVGSVLGPSFGGALAKPAEKFPETFGGVEFWEKYPFFLPNLVASGMFVVGLATGILFLEETLDVKKHRRDYGRVLGYKLTSLFKRSRSPPAKSIERAPLLEDGASLKSLASPKPPSWREVFNRQSTLNLIAYTFLALHNIASDQLLAVFLHYPVRTPSSSLKFVSGFGFSSGSIGLIFTTYGLFGMIIQFTIYPYAASRFGVLRCFKTMSAVAPLLYLFIPFTALPRTTGLRVAALAPLLLLKITTVIHNFPSSMILLTNAAGSKRVLGTLNGVAVSVSALGRATGPVLVGFVDAWGRRRGYAVLPWFLLFVLAAVGTVPVWWLEEGEGFGNEGDLDEAQGDGQQVEVGPLRKASGRGESTPDERVRMITERQQRSSEDHTGS